jgi:hypothetical protein
MARFTAANAREMAARSVDARKQRNSVPALPPLPPVQPADQFAKERLARVRAQQERIDAMILAETDPQKLDRLASASMRLSDQEFALAGRPKPANRKVPPERTQRIWPEPILYQPKP